MRRRPCAPASQAFVDLTAADELMVVSAIYDHAARLRSFEILAEIAEVSAPERLGMPS